MDLKIDRLSRVPIYQQISRQIEEKILSLELPEGFKLPSERRLADEMEVHRNTVIKAYDTLIAVGLIVVSRDKPKGYFVKAAHVTEQFHKRFFPLEKAFLYEFRKAEKTFNDIYCKSETEDMISFAGITMNNKLESVTGMENVVKTIFRSEKSNMKTFHDETERLRANICKILKEQNIYASTRNIQILAESNQTISYLMLLYLKEGDCIVAEGPMVPDNYSIFYNRGIHVVIVPMEEDGMNMEILEEYIRAYKPKFIYTQPNYHNPTGITMSIQKRKTLLNIADYYNIPIIEEDYQWEFGYEETKLPSLYSLDMNKMVIYVYSFTLIFPYMMKIGYALGPADLIEMLGSALSVDETAVGGVGQYFINEYIESGAYDSHRETVKTVYKAKLDLLCNEIDKISNKGITYAKPKGGLLLWCKLDEKINERLLCKLMEKKGVLVVPGWVFYENSKKKSGHIRICFSNVTDDQIRQGIKIIGEALDQCRL